ncbi:MAG TPA: NAD-dependent epimerase/dehydratase family protein [Gemmatimonadales bacterium]|nr:NAD-dependent epimerase/dehydratase family protein [Gemmatimonadales bacterium]
MRILLVGGAGFIGRHLARRLAAAGHQLTVLDSLTVQVHGKSADFPAEVREAADCVRGDARRSRDLRKVLPGQELIYWLAAETGTGQSMYRVGRYLDTNVAALATLLDELVGGRANPPKIVLTSSRAVSGEGGYRCPKDGLVTPGPRSGLDPVHGWSPRCPACGGSVQPVATGEQLPPRPTSVYGWTKLAQEQLFQVVGEAIDLDYSILRLHNVYGPGQALGNPYTGVLMVFFNRALDGEPLILFEDGEITRDFVHVNDVVSALEAAGLRPATDRRRVYTIGSGTPVTIRAAAEAIRAVAGSSSPISVGGQFRVGDIRFALADSSRAEAELGYRPRVSFTEGLTRLLPWVREQQRPRDRSDQSAREMARIGLLRGWKS